MTEENEPARVIPFLNSLRIQRRKPTPGPTASSFSSGYSEVRVRGDSFAFMLCINIVIKFRPVCRKNHTVITRSMTFLIAYGP